jgi:hypothetical protein
VFRSSRWAPTNWTSAEGNSASRSSAVPATLTQLPQFEWQVFCFQRRHVEVFTAILQTRGVQGLPGQVFAARLPDGQWDG